jgi:Uma2 family endonuclease
MSPQLAQILLILRIDSKLECPHQNMIGKRRLDLTIDPPPDLAIEVDVTSKTQLSAYAILGVPELWRFSQGILSINVLECGEYVESLVSPNFPGIPIIDGVAQFVQMSLNQGSSAALRTFRQWVREIIS